MHIKKLEEILTVGSSIFFQTHFYPMIKVRSKADELFLSFKAKDGKELPVLLNVYVESGENNFEIHCGGMQISQRNRFEKELLEAKNIAEKALLENEELVSMRNKLQENQHTLEQQLRELSRINQYQNQINKVLSHDLQEPLRKIGFFSSRLLDDYKATIDESASEALNKISGLTNKTRSLLDSLQRFNSLDERELNYESIQLRDVLVEAKHKARIQEEDAAVQFSETIFPDFSADKKMMISLFYELINNSMKFRNAAIPVLEIKIGAELIMQNLFKEVNQKYQYEQFVRITYADNAMGFSNTSDDIFNIFRKAHHVIDGVGVGLAYCRKICELHHGSITAVSSEGKGTSFTILLPAKKIV